MRDYLALITQQHAQRPRFRATVALSVEPFVHMQGVLREMLPAFDLDTAVGQQLDTIGKWVGVTRANTVPLAGVAFIWDGAAEVGWDNGVWEGVAGFDELPDDLYRAVIKAKIVANHGRGDKETAYRVIETACGATNVARILENDEIAAFQDWFTWDGTPQNGWDSGAWEMPIGDIMTMLVLVRTSVPAALRALILGGALPIKPAGVTAYYTTFGA